MAGRHEAREWAVQFLFQRDFNKEDLDAELDEFFEDKGSTGKARAFAEELIRGVEANGPELDVLIKKYAEHWDLARMGGVDRNAMRVGLFEMLHRPDIPPVVSINEAVEIAKSLSGRESGKFVNGILDRASKDLDRPARVRSDQAQSSKE